MNKVYVNSEGVVLAACSLDSIIVSPEGCTEHLSSNAPVFNGRKIIFIDGKCEPTNEPHIPETYVTQRIRSYPSLEVLADALYWQSQGDGSKLADYLDAVSRVKAEFPKPNQA